MDKNSTAARGWDMNRDEKLDKLFADFYFGEGKDNPPMVVRMANVEGAIERWSKNSSMIVWLLIGLLAERIPDVIALLKHIP